MKAKWTWEQDCGNSINILKDGEKVCQIISDNDITSVELQQAKEICKGMNLYEKGKS